MFKHCLRSSEVVGVQNFRHFGKILQVFGNFLTVYFCFGKFVTLLGQF